jgi:hypothetical protein
MPPSSYSRCQVRTVSSSNSMTFAPRSSSHHPTTPARWRAGPVDEPRNHRGPAQSGRYAIRGRGSRRGSCNNWNRRLPRDSPTVERTMLMKITNIRHRNLPEAPRASNRSITSAMAC